MRVYICVLALLFDVSFYDIFDILFQPLMVYFWHQYDVSKDWLLIGIKYICLLMVCGTVLGCVPLKLVGF